MSRKPSTSIRPTTTGTMPSASILPSDICPVCKRVRYLNTDMEFLINPECYHAMCSNCVSNIFKSGPAQCPYASCTKTLRQRGFRRAFFGDLTVEREVDVRRRVAAVFNMEADDFETLRDYNNYLQEVEDLTFDLVSGSDPGRVADAEDRLRAHEQAHRDGIERNKRKGREAEALRRRRDADEADASRRRRAEERDQEVRARAEEAKVRDEVMEALARGEPGSAAEIQDRIVTRKRAQLARIAGSEFVSSLRDAAAANASATSSSTATAAAAAAAHPGAKNSLLSIRGLKDKARIAADEEEDLARTYDPFGGLDLASTRYTLRDESGQGRGHGYENPWLADARTRDDHRVPGYDPREYVARALFEAFAGLGISVADEKKAAGVSARQQKRADALGAATAGTAASAVAAAAASTAAGG